MKRALLLGFFMLVFSGMAHSYGMQCAKPVITNALVETSSTFSFTCTNTTGVPFGSYKIYPECKSGNCAPGSFTAAACNHTIPANGGTCLVTGSFTPTTADNFVLDFDDEYGSERHENIFCNSPQGCIDVKGLAQLALTTTGTYFNNMVNRYVPFVLNSLNTGINWTGVNINLITLPTAASGDSELYGVTCNGSLCTGVGYYKASSLEYPMILNSITSGNSWTPVQAGAITLPSDHESSKTGQLNSVVCNAGLCTAVGSYANTLGAQFPLILNNDSSGNWVAVAVTMPTDFTPDTNSQLFSIACHATTCTAVGYYMDTDCTTQPLILNRTGSGAWTGVQTNNITLPEDLVIGEDTRLLSVSCNGMLCTAVGYYNNTTSSLILNSNDGGSSWKAVDSNHITPSDFLDQANLRSVSCQGSLCTAVGNYSNSAIIPLILNSTNQGLDWTGVDATNVTLPGDYTSSSVAELNAVTCEDVLCTGTGIYNGGTLPLILNSTNQGLSWSAPIVPGGIVFPTNFLLGGLDSVSG